MKRLESLDWLRGLMALSIMLYHLAGQYDSNTVLGRIGIYGVGVFFILSGLSMGIAYDRFIVDARSAVAFLIRRIFRIWPLLWVAIAAVVIPGMIAGKRFKVLLILANLTTIYGFARPWSYINGGAWSLGNEMVYYALTPLLIFAYHQGRWLGNFVLVLTVFVAGLFAFHWLHLSSGLDVQWKTYINPFNNLFLYCAGIALYFNFRRVELRQGWHIPLFLAFPLAFAFFPASGDQISIVTGASRMFLSAICVGVVFAFYKCPPSLPRSIASVLSRLGEISYGVYLLHPIVWEHAKHILGNRPVFVAVAVIPISIFASSLTFRYIESPFKHTENG